MPAQPSMRRQWLTVGIVAVHRTRCLAGGARFAPAQRVAQIGRRAPDYRVLRLATGDSIGVRSGFKGHVTLINVWATWCGPCVKEMPSMERVFQAYRDRGFRVAAVSIDDGAPAPVIEFAQRLGLSFDILHDRSGEIQTPIMTVGVPESFLVDKRGRDHLHRARRRQTGIPSRIAQRTDRTPARGARLRCAFWRSKHPATRHPPQSSGETATPRRSPG